MTLSTTCQHGKRSDVIAKATFSVVAMVRETADVIERFARHHLKLGAEAVRLYFDGEVDEVPVVDLPGLEVTVCDQLFWTERLERMPSDLDEGLRTIFREAHESCTSDWQFYCDVDEFLISNEPVAVLLKRLPDEVSSLRIMNVEAVWGPDDSIDAAFGCTYFRVPLDRKKEKALRFLLPYRQHEQFRKGIVGHCAGKHFLRRGTIIDRYSSHNSERNGADLGVWASDLGLSQNDVFVAHFDAISEARWTEKWRRRLSQERPSIEMGPQRLAQAHAVERATAKGSMPELFRSLYTISWYEASVLKFIGGTRRHKIFPGDN